MMCNIVGYTQQFRLRLVHFGNLSSICWQYRLVSCFTVTTDSLQPEKEVIQTDNDLKIVCRFRLETLGESVSQIQGDLNNLTNWSEKCPLPFNLNKCGIMNFGKSLYGPQPHLNKIRVQTLKSINELEIYYTGRLKFEDHASFIISRFRPLICFIIKNFTTEAKLNLYKICTKPFIEYWSFTFSNYIPWTR